MIERIICDDYTESFLLDVLRAGGDTRNAALRRCTLLQTYGKTVEPLRRAIEAFEFKIEDFSENAEIPILDLPFPVVVSAQTMQNAHLTFSERYEEPDDPAQRFFAVVTPLERRVFYVDESEHYLYRIMSYLVTLRNDAPERYIKAFNAPVVLKELSSRSQIHPFLQEAAEDWALGFYLDGLMNICRAFQFEPRRETRGHGGILFENASVRDFTIRPLRMCIRAGNHDELERAASCCYAILSTNKHLKRYLKAKDQAKLNVEIEGQDLRDLIQAKDRRFVDLDPDSFVYNVRDDAQLETLFKILNEKRFNVPMSSQPQTRPSLSRAPRTFKISKRRGNIPLRPKRSVRISTALERLSSHTLHSPKV